MERRYIYLDVALGLRRCLMMLGRKGDCFVIIFEQDSVC